MNGAIEELRQEIAKSQGGSLSPASDEDLERARQFGFPEILLRFYREGAPNTVDGCIELGQRIWSLQNAIFENRDYVPGANLFPLGYIVFASNKCGDAYCLDTIHVGTSGDAPIVLFPHDAIEDGASLSDVEPLRLQVAIDLNDFLRQFARRTLVEEPKYNSD